MAAYYNEIDPYAAQWLRNLIEAGHIAPGDVDQRSIEDVHPDDLKPYTQCHFFAGIGVWSYALRLAGWADDRPVWTGSCPCQPFSETGQGSGFADERHLWPALHHLINERRPVVVFGEQVAGKGADAWFDLVQADVEGMGYAFGLVPFPSAGVGAHQIRERAYWVASAQSIGRRQECQDQRWGHPGNITERNPAGSSAGGADIDWIPGLDGRVRPIKPGIIPVVDGHAGNMGRLRAYGNAINAQAAQEFIAAYLESTQGN